MGLFDRTPLTPRLLDPANWKGTDDDWWLMRWRIYIKHWFAFSFRSPAGIALSFVMFPLWFFQLPIVIIPVARKWRRIPTVLWARKSALGAWRFEKTGAEDRWSHMDDPNEFLKREENKGYYLSRIQYWTENHFAIHWPWLTTGNHYYDAADVLKPGNRGDTDGKVFSFYKGWHYDGDETFWGDGGGAGNFK